MSPVRMTVLPSAALLLLLLGVACLLVVVSEGSSLTSCEVYRLAQVYNLPGDPADWSCLASYGSNYQTHVRSKDIIDTAASVHGLLSIHNSYCRHHKRANETICGTTLCTELEDNAIADDLNCAKYIHGVGGFSSWPIWTRHCSGQDLSSFRQNCA